MRLEHGCGKGSRENRGRRMKGGMEVNGTWVSVSMLAADKGTTKEQSN